MELLVGIAIIGILLLWLRVNDLGAQVRDARASLDELEGDILRLRGALAAVAAAARSTAGPAGGRERPQAEDAITERQRRRSAAAAAIVGEPLAAPKRTAAESVPAPSWKGAPEQGATLVSAEAAVTTPFAPVDERARVAAVKARLQADAPILESPWVASEPEGPGLWERLQATLGLTDPGGGRSRASLEAWLEGRLLAVVGGIALLLGAVFFLSLAFSRGWITEPMRVLIGLGAGAGLLILGELAFSRLRGIVGHVLVAVGLAVISLALFAATAQYHLVSVELGLLGAFVAAIAAALIAVRHDSQLVAAFGLVTVLAAPPLLGASTSLVTLLFVGAALVGTTAVALFRTWIWLPPIAFVLTVPQLASYLFGRPPIEQALVAIAGFWLVNAIAAGGEEARHRSDRLRPTTVTLLLANAAFTLVAGFIVLDGSLEAWRGTFVAAMAVAHLGLGLAFLIPFGDRHPFGLVVAGTGVAALAMAVPVQAGGPPVPIAWAAEAVALAWVAVLRRHPYSAAVSVVLGVLALAHLVAVEYPVDRLAAGFDRTYPFVGPEGMTFAFIVAAAAVAVAVVPIAWVRAGLAAVAGLVAIYVAPFELSGPALVAAWSAIAAVGLVAHARVVVPRIARTFREGRTPALGLPAPIAPFAARFIAGLSGVTRPAFLATSLLAGVAAIAHLPAFEYAIESFKDAATPLLPFVGLPGLAFAIVLAAIAVVGLAVGVAWVRVGLVALAGLIAWYVMPFELSGPALVWAWAALAAVMFALEARVIAPRMGRPDSGWLGAAPDADVAFAAADAGADAWEPLPTIADLVRPAVLAVGALATLSVLGHLLAFDFPIDRVGQVTVSTIPYGGWETVALGGMVALLVVTSWVAGRRWVVLGAAGIGLSLLVYTLTFEVPLPWLAATWAIATCAALVVVRRLPEPIDALAWTSEAVVRSTAERLPFVAAGLGLVHLIIQSFILGTPSGFIDHVAGWVAPDTTFFVDERAFVLVMLALALVVGAWVWRGTDSVARGLVLAAIPVAWLIPFEVRPGYAVAAWAALALGGFALARVVRASRSFVTVSAVAMLAVAAGVAITVVAPPDRLLVDSSTIVVGFPWLSDATVGLAGIVLALGIGSYLHRHEAFALEGLAAAGIGGVYLLSVAVVDAFQRQVLTRPLDELQFQAQVGLSILWSILGGIAFATGLVTHRPPIRLFGLALLGLATVKVFLVDLVGLPIEQRVLSLVALGVLLLLSATVYARLQHPHGPAAAGHV